MWTFGSLVLLLLPKKEHGGGGGTFGSDAPGADARGGDAVAPPWMTTGSDVEATFSPPWMTTGTDVDTEALFSPTVAG